jgi:ubiquinone/menaquinone biosynthesis C-methylase UbiE
MKIINYQYFEKLNLAYNNPSHLMHKKMKHILNYVRGGESLIDIGCGTGEFIAQLKERFNRLIGIDTSSHAIEFTAKRVGKDRNILLECGGLESLHFPAEHFDVCLCLDVLEHVKDLSLLLEEIYRILRPGAEIIVTVPNWYDIIISGIFRVDPLHINTFTPWRWMRLLKRAGFKIKFYRAVDFPILKSDLLARKIYFLGMGILIVAVRQPDHGNA